jgi:hypothetical protein
MSIETDIEWPPVGLGLILLSASPTPHSLAISLLRLVSKARVLSAQPRHPGSGCSASTIDLSDVDDPTVGGTQLSRIEDRLTSLEAKLDHLLAIRLSSQSPPAWYAASEQRLLTSVSNLSRDCLRIAADSRSEHDLSARLRHEVENLAAGADKFLAGLAVQLTKSECALFLDLIASVQDGAVRRVLTYSEIGKQRGVSKQAIHKAYKSLAAAHTSVGDYIESVRHPETPRNFSELSPTDRQEHGIDSTYDHPVG